MVNIHETPHQFVPDKNGMFCVETLGDHECDVFEIASIHDTKQYRCSVCGSDDRVEHNDEMHAQEGIW
jgi:hypothetical protein